MPYCALKRREKRMQEKVVIVIGAGIAGVAAAHRLESYGYKVIILEAWHDIGGRTRISHDISLGPLIIHEAGPYPEVGGITRYLEEHPDYFLDLSTLPREQPIPALFDKYGIPYWSKDVVSDQDILLGGKEANHFDLSLFNKQYKAYTEHYNYHNQLADLSGQDDNSTENAFAKLLIRKFEEAYSGLNIEELTQFMSHAKSRGIEFFRYGEDDLPIENDGYYKLIKKIGNELARTEIHCNVIVKEIVDSSGTVKVFTDSGKIFEGHAVIPTLPIGVLKKGTVEIRNLSEKKQAAIQRLKMGMMNKVNLKFETPFWNNENFRFVTLNVTKGERPITLFNNINKYTRNKEWTLTAGFFADDAIRDKQILINDAKNAIKRAWPQTPDPYFVEASAWHLDPYTYGSYASFSKDTTANDIMHIMMPEWDGRLVLAGDGIVPIGLMGCFHGAYISGLRAAHLVNRELSARLQ